MGGSNRAAACSIPAAEAAPGNCGAVASFLVRLQELAVAAGWRWDEAGGCWCRPVPRTGGVERLITGDQSGGDLRRQCTLPDAARAGRRPSGTIGAWS